MKVEREKERKADIRRKENRELKQESRRGGRRSSLAAGGRGLFHNPIPLTKYPRKSFANDVNSCSGRVRNPGKFSKLTSEPTR